MKKKSDLPQKICLACQKPFTWRKKWERVWEEVKYCSNRCRSQKRTLFHEFKLRIKKDSI